MNSSIIRYILGYILKIEAALLIFPCITAVIYKEQQGFAFLIVAILCAALGYIMSMHKPKNTVFYLKEGCVATSLSWVVLSFFGALPYYINGDIPSFTNALFETVSGFTTTGASILNDVEALSHCSLLWRSFTNWIGGMGVLMFLLAIIPLSGGSHINLMRAESPGPSVGKLVPKVKYTARILYMIYVGMTVLEIIFLLLGRMPLFDAINIGIATAGTGGFAVKNDSIMGYSPYLQWVVTIFMILFGINFNAYYLILYGKFKKAFKMEEVRYYLLIIIASIAIIFANTLRISAGVFDAITKASFQVATVISSSGFSTANFDLWPGTSKTVLVMLMFIGACAGSTGGGIKVSRIVIMVKTVFKELNSYIHPKSVKKVSMDGKLVEHEVVRSINVFSISFVILFALSVFLISIDGYDLVTNFTATIATFNNIGPGLAMVGPAQNYDIFSGFSKFILMFNMLAGRLELFPMLILFHPALWKEMVNRRRLIKK